MSGCHFNVAVEASLLAVTVTVNDSNSEWLSVLHLRGLYLASD